MSEILRLAYALSELRPSAPDQYVAAGFRIIGSAVQSHEGLVAVFERIRDPLADPLHGFRVMNVWMLGERNVGEPTVVNRVMAEPDAMIHDPIIKQVAGGRGTHRTFHEPDPRTIAGLENSIDAHVWRTLGLCDQLKLAHASSTELEIIITFRRFIGEHRFSMAQAHLLNELNPGLALWARRLALLHGCGAGKRLAPRESEMLALLLGALQQKTFASALGVSAARAAELVRDVHRKLGTQGRADLQHRWMSNTVTSDTCLPVTRRTRRRQLPQALKQRPTA